MHDSFVNESQTRSQVVTLAESSLYVASLYAYIGITRFCLFKEGEHFAHADLKILFCGSLQEVELLLTVS